MAPRDHVEALPGHEGMTQQTARRSSAPGADLVAGGEDHSRTRRLLSPSEAAAYLGLTSRFAIYRLVASGSLPAVRLANKLRLDLRDLDAAIGQAKTQHMRPAVPPARAALKPRAIPRELAAVRRKSVTVPVTHAPAR